jgi:phage-related protein
MAITPLTGFKALTFDGEKSTDYGVAILGEGVFNAPKRDVDMITIPGRNGQFVLDNGRFENIEVTYPANLIANDAADFAEAISDFRNMLCSKRGYVRLQDDYHPNEYRMAVFKDDLDVDEKVLKAGEFKITFDCKPQRWLTSGETAVTVTSGDTLTNPTLFESGPLLEATGYGVIGFNGYEIDFDGVPYGEIVIGEKGRTSYFLPYTMAITLDTTLMNSGDPIYPEPKEFDIETYIATSSDSGKYFTNVSVASTTNSLDAYTTKEGLIVADELHLHLLPDFGSGFKYGTAKTITSSAVYKYRVEGSSTDYTETFQVDIAYDGADTYTVSVTKTGTLAPDVVRGANIWLNYPTMYGNSSKIITDPIFIDCDLGEAYIVEDGVYRSLNQYIDLGSELPKLASGSNTVTFDNTITELKVTPRWWKV